MMHRRQVLQQGIAGVVASQVAGSGWAQSGKPAATSGPGICQILDTSPSQQDVSRDFLVGSRAAWQEINARGGLKGRKVQHIVQETDGSLASVSAALDTARDNPACLALAGSAGDPLAQMLTQSLARNPTGMAHLAPWLQTSAFDADGRTFPIFASRREQIEYAVKSLSLMGMNEIGAVYAGAAELGLYREEVERTSSALNVRARHFPSGNDLAALGQRMAPGTPAVLLFLGGTPELVQFTQGLEMQSRQRYVIAMADVNLQTLQQMGAARKTPIIATQVVPVTSASLPVVRSYRESLGRFFDEPPTALSLAGYISARTTFELLASVDGTLTRASLLAATQRAPSLDVGGFRISFSGQRRTSSYVTQSMLTADGRVLG
jgi:ABC-type branched-subunit amino acid transport system substrate-binding protein